MSSNNKRKRGGRLEITFDPEARRSYLQGFSERKRQRRAYGLAMQKVKDRKAKLQMRKELKEAEMEQIQEAEKQKEDLMNAALQENFPGEDDHDTGTDGDDNNNTDTNSPEEGQQKPEAPSTKKKTETTKITYEDEQMKSQWGGQVVVTTSFAPLEESSDDEALWKKQRGQKRQKRSTDAEQEYAGNVEKFLAEMKGKLPGKKGRQNHQKTKRKGKHGASDMKGIAGASNMKAARKILQKSSAQQGKPTKGSKKRRGKK